MDKQLKKFLAFSLAAAVFGFLVIALAPRPQITQSELANRSDASEPREKRAFRSQSYWSALTVSQSSTLEETSSGSTPSTWSVSSPHWNNLAGGFIGSFVLRSLGESTEGVPSGFGVLDGFILGGCAYLIARSWRLSEEEKDRKRSLRRVI